MNEMNEKVIIVMETQLHFYYKKRLGTKWTWKEDRGNERPILHNEKKKIWRVKLEYWLFDYWER
jgi:hypothetical protein